MRAARDRRTAKGFWIARLFSTSLIARLSSGCLLYLFVVQEITSKTNCHLQTCHVVNWKPPRARPSDQTSLGWTCKLSRWTGCSRIEEIPYINQCFISCIWWISVSSEPGRASRTGDRGWGEKRIQSGARNGGAPMSRCFRQPALRSPGINGFGRHPKPEEPKRRSSSQLPGNAVL